MTTELRRVEGPGKFEGGLMVDEYLYGLTLDGGHDEKCGSSTEGSGWYGLLAGPFDGRPIVPGDDELTDSEREYVASLAGAIVFESTDGFVAVDHYTDKDQLDSAWSKILANDEPEDEEKTFSVIEYSSFFAVRHNPTGEERPMGDGVDTLFCGDSDTYLSPGDPGFVESWEDCLNSDENETLRAYFPEFAED